MVGMYGMRGPPPPPPDAPPNQCPACGFVFLKEEAARACARMHKLGANRK